MINAEFLASCTDEQINRGVAWLSIKEWGLDSKHKRKSIDYYCSQGLLNSVAAGNVNYCTNPSDIMPIAFDSGIAVGPVSWGKGTSTHYAKHYPLFSYNTNPLRAICEVYILMSVNK